MPRRSTNAPGLPSRAQPPARTWAARGHPIDPTAQFKEAYREGSIREKGTVTVAGRRARRLVIEHDPQTVVDLKLVVRSSRTIALFDAQTTEPIEFIDESVIEADGQRGTVVLHTRYATFEKLPRTPENLAKLRMSKKP